MEIDFNPSRVPKAEPSQPAARPSAPASVDGTSFQDTAALQEKVKNLPSTRPEKVAAAKALMADTNFPPDYVLKRVAVLLATNINQ
jgi:hypothetical protein